MATTVGQHSVATFTTPSNGDALDANVVKGNDNTTRDAYVAHDSDSGIHIQSSLLAARPAAGTVGRKWMTTDTANVKLFYDNGSAWENLDYLPTAGNVAITGNLTVAGTTTLTGTVGLPSGTTMTGATLNNTTFTGTVTGISMNPTVYYSALSSSINISYSGLTTVLTLSSVPAGTYLISALTNGRAFGSSGTVGMNAQIRVNGVEVASTVSYADATTQYTPCFQTTTVSTLASSSNITLQVMAAGSGATPVVYGGATVQTFISATRIN